MLNSRRCCPGLGTGNSASDTAGRTLVEAAFTRSLRLADEERTAHLSSSVSPACVLMLDQTSKGSRSRLACDLRKTNTADITEEVQGLRRRDSTGTACQADQETRA